MSAAKALYELAQDDAEGVICALADLAEVLRDVRLTGVPVPNVCPFVHAPSGYFAWGRDRWCTCGWPTMPADRWHRLLFDALRATRYGDYRRAA